MKHTKHLICRFCSKPLTHTFVDLGMSPIANDYVKKENGNRMEPLYPLHVYVCSDCLLVQLPNIRREDEIFTDEYAYFSSYSTSWLKHAKSYVDQMMKRFNFTSDNLVVELASNDGYLLQYFKELHVPVLGVEPTANTARVAREKGIPTIVKFFGVDTARHMAKKKQMADLLIGNNVLAHVPDLNDFIAGMRIILNPNGVITMEFPHLLALMEKKQFDTIYHEHFSYFSFRTVEMIFAYHGITLFDVEEIPTHGGSIRIFGKHRDNTTHAVTDRVRALRKKEHDAGLDRLSGYASFAQSVAEIKKNALEFLIHVKRDGKTIVGYGAPAKGNTFLNYCGIRTDFLDYTVDASPHKQNVLLPGTHIPVYHPDKIFETKPDYILILPWNLKEEVMEQLKDVRDWGCKFIVCIPELSVYKDTRHHREFRFHQSGLARFFAAIASLIAEVGLFI